MANQVPNCPLTAGLLIKCVGECSLKLKPNGNFYFHFKIRPVRRAGSAKHTLMIQNQPPEGV